MNKRKVAIPLLIAVICAGIILIYALNFANQPSAAAETPSEPTSDNSDNPDGPLFVIPESPLGTLGLFSGVAAAFVIFGVIRKKGANLSH